MFQREVRSPELKYFNQQIVCMFYVYVANNISNEPVNTHGKGFWKVFEIDPLLAKYTPKK